MIVRAETSSTMDVGARARSYAIVLRVSRGSGTVAENTMAALPSGDEHAAAARRKRRLATRFSLHLPESVVVIWHINRICASSNQRIVATYSRISDYVTNLPPDSTH